jgi:hypothetical protein
MIPHRRAGAVAERHRDNRIGIAFYGVDLHHGFGVLVRVAPQTNGTARPSSIRMAPTSWPPALSVPHSRPQLQAMVPSVPMRHKHATGP